MIKYVMDEVECAAMADSTFFCSEGGSVESELSEFSEFSEYSEYSEFSGKLLSGNSSTVVVIEG